METITQESRQSSSQTQSHHVHSFQTLKTITPRLPTQTLKQKRTKFHCQVCEKPTILCCANCKAVFYCSIDCQKAQWIIHNQECRAPESEVIELKPKETTKYETPLKVSNSVSRKRTSNDVTDPEIIRGDLTRKTTIKTDKSERTPIGNKMPIRFSLEPKGEVEDLGIMPKIEDEQEPEAESVIAPKKQQREAKLKGVLRFYMKNQYEEAVLKARALFEIAKEIFETDENGDIYEFVGDGLLLVKCLIAGENILKARENLIFIWEIVKDRVSDKRIEFKNPNDKPSKLRPKYKELAIHKTFVDHETLSFERKKEINEQIQKNASLFSAFGAFFHDIGDFRHSEEAYISYVRVIESNFGSAALETSNCYFLLGAFYTEHKFYTKAMACLKTALKIRQLKFQTDHHESIADCCYNIAIVYKQTQKTLKAVKYLNNALKIRSNLIGEVSLPVSQVLELLGKIAFEEEDYKVALARYQDCLVIRTKILNDEVHQDINRVRLLIKDLLEVVEAKLQNEKIAPKKKEILLQVKKDIEERSLHLIPKIPTPPQPSPLKEPSSPLKPVFIRLETNADEGEHNFNTQRFGGSPVIKRDRHSTEMMKSTEDEGTKLRADMSPDHKSSRALKVSSNPVILNFLKKRAVNKDSLPESPYLHSTDGNLSIRTGLEKDKAGPAATRRIDLMNRNEDVILEQPRKFTTLPKQHTLASTNLTSSPEKNELPNPDDVVKQAEKVLEKMMPKGNSKWRKAFNTVAKKREIKSLNISEGFLETIDKKQILLLNKLNIVLIENPEDKLEELVVQSEFFESLTPAKKDILAKSNPTLAFNKYL